MTTVLHSANAINIKRYIDTNISVTYKKEGDLSSYGVNIDLYFLKELPSFGVNQSFKHFSQITIKSNLILGQSQTYQISCY